ncbi:MAG TPA: ABC transporter ATP-binding protein [Candidatus Dormibacteraeota bacterium]|nr:ABC transporter ATP-binding protein [Candidatus Dormibacteraeota bacterium]
MISLEHVTKRYGERVAVDDLSVDIAAGELAVLVGPSGCGKTTTLRMINRLVEPTAGTIRVDGRDTRERPVTELRRSIGYVIQQGGLLPHLTVAENVATVPRLLRWDRARIRARVDELLELVGLPPAEYAARLPRALSGGERQRVGVARALGADPPVLLMDEPFSALDPITRLRLQGELLRVQSLVRKTIVVVTHDIDEALRLGDRVVLMRTGGRIAQVDTPAALLARPASDFVAGFLGGDRTLRRLALVPLRAAELRPADGSAPVERVEAGASLRDALEAVLRSPDGRAAVVDGDRIVGVADAEVIRRAAAAG